MPEEAAPRVEGVHQQETCADLAQASDSMGTQIPPLKGPATSELTSSPTTDSGYAETVPRQELEEGDDQGALHTASLWAQSPSPEPQPAETTPSLEKDKRADTPPGFEGNDMVGASFPMEDNNVYATPVATPPPAPEGEDDAHTLPGALSPVDDPQLRVSPKNHGDRYGLERRTACPTKEGSS